jgi:hypothetical protein
VNGFKSQGAQKPTAFGSLTQNSSYGGTIPVIYGQTQGVILPIWAANLRQGGGIKKFKQFKKGITNYVENIDILLGHAPMRGVLQLVNNGGLFRLVFTSVEIDYPVTPGSITIDDADFYFVIAVSILQNYSFTFDDYGGTGSRTVSGTWEYPCWNETETGPDPTHPSLMRNYPFNYNWKGTYGNTILIPNGAFPAATVKVYYAQLTDATSFETPLAKNNLFFEYSLGEGPEYSDAGSPFDEQAIVYPQFSGMASSDLDLGASGAIPQLLPEIAGKWGVYPTGDADFVDMIEDIFKSGLAQAALDSDQATTQQERGLSCYQLPGCIQQRLINGIGEHVADHGSYIMPTTTGNLLIVIATGASELDAPTISDTAGNVWTLQTSALGLTANWAVWTATAVGGNTTISVNNSNLSAAGLMLLEVYGVDTFDSFEVVNSTGDASITTSSRPNSLGYILAIPFFGASSGPSSIYSPGWYQLPFGYVGSIWFLIQERITAAAGSYSIDENATPQQMILIAMKAVNPVSYPMPLGDLIDLDSLNLVRAQSRANGLWGSLAMLSQSSASEWLKSLYQAANAAPVFLGSKLFSYPYSEVSAAGNGAAYVAPTASGPIAELSVDNGDFIGENTPELETVSRVDSPNVLQMQIVSREDQYNQVVIAQPEAASIALYGIRKADAVVNNAIQDESVARMILGIQVRKNQYGGDSYSFTLSPRWMLLSPMDLITITDELANIVGVPVRLTSCEEQDDLSTACKAEPFIYGMYAPTPYTTTSPTPNPFQTNITAGDVNPPIIFEPVPDLTAEAPQAQLWLVISSSADNYGGCQVFISTNGGTSYVQAAPPLLGSATTGELTAGWPAGTTPDTVNDLAVSLAESNGTLDSYPISDEDNFVYPCYVEGADMIVENDGTAVASGVAFSNNGTPASGPTDLVDNDGISVAAPSFAWNYELMTYAVADLTGANQYTLKATGSGNHLDRAVFNAPNSGGVGIAHTTGERFALLSPNGTGICKLSMASTWIGVELFFKVLSFNEFGTALQNLSDVTAYNYTPTGVPYA